MVLIFLFKEKVKIFSKSFTLETALTWDFNESLSSKYFKPTFVIVPKTIQDRKFISHRAQCFQLALAMASVKNLTFNFESLNKIHKTLVKKCATTSMHKIIDPPVSKISGFEI